MSNKIYGYARVSTLDQKLDLQIEALKAAGCDTIFEEKMSGVKADRPQLTRLLRQLEPGDTFVVTKLDRASRSLRDLINLGNFLTNKGTKFRSLSESIDTETVTGKLLFGIMASVAEFERALIEERTNQGKTAARARGVKFGRPVRVTPDKLQKAQALRDAGIDMHSIAQTLGVSRAALYKQLKKKEAELMTDIFK